MISEAGLLLVLKLNHITSTNPIFRRVMNQNLNTKQPGKILGDDPDVRQGHGCLMLAEWKRCDLIHIG